jgi:hypothetical protein
VRLLLCIAGLALGSTASATEIGSERTLGGGLVLGYPSGLSGKAYLGDVHAVDAQLASWGFGFNVVYAHASWLYEPVELLQNDLFSMPLHVGAGPMLLLGAGGVSAGLRVPVGVDINLHDVPVQIFVDAAVAATIVPGVRLGWGGGGVGARYYF